jgi:hypothetical protein
MQNAHSAKILVIVVLSWSFKKNSFKIAVLIL